MNTALRVVVVDDEQLAREELCYQLEQIDGIEIVAQASNGIEAIGAVGGPWRQRLPPLTSKLPLSAYSVASARSVCVAFVCCPTPFQA